MKKQYLLVLSILVGSFSTLRGQDPHFSQYFASPLHFNAAMTGAFNGNYRFTSIYRNQWQSILRGNPADQSGTPAFRTYAGSFDLRLNPGSGKSGALGIGVLLLSDVAGAAKMRSTSSLLSLSYIKALDRQTTQFLSIGIQGGIIQRSIDYANLMFGSQYDNTSGFNPALNSGEDLGDNNYLYGDLSAGLLWYYLKNDRTNFYLGAALHHLNRPEQSFLGDESSPLPPRFTINGGAEFKIVRHVSLLPTLLYMRQGKFNEMNIGANAKMFFRSDLPLRDAVFLGLYYRMVGGESFVSSESLIVNTKLHFKNVALGASYDLLVSDLARSSLNGGFEISVMYSGSFGKKKDVIHCPRW